MLDATANSCMDDVPRRSTYLKLVERRGTSSTNLQQRLPLVSIYDSETRQGLGFCMISPFKLKEQNSSLLLELVHSLTHSQPFSGI